MILIYATHKDGCRTLFRRVDDDFDVEDWAARMKDNFRMLGVVSVSFESVPAPSEAG